MQLQKLLTLSAFIAFAWAACFIVQQPLLRIVLIGSLAFMLYLLRSNECIMRHIKIPDLDDVKDVYKNAEKKL